MGVLQTPERPQNVAPTSRPKAFVHNDVFYASQSDNAKVLLPGKLSRLSAPTTGIGLALPLADVPLR
jgi:hypothetical protein